jgi:hypothetical protein
MVKRDDDAAEPDVEEQTVLVGTVPPLTTPCTLLALSDWVLQVQALAPGVGYAATVVSTATNITVT